MKKIPSLFRKKYTAKKLERKIFKKLYVPEDKKYVKGLFVEVAKKGKKQIPVFAIPQEKREQLAKKEMKRLKLLAKQIKKQKGRINFLPLIVTAAVIVAIPVTFIMFKNVILKHAIIYACENVFEARCDIESLDFKLLDSSLKIKKVEIANKNDYMKNLVDIDSITLDFDLNQLLRKRFVAEELSVLDVYTGTERKISGELSEKRKKQIEKRKTKKEKAASESEFGKVLAEKKAVAASSLKENITGLFNQLNPEALMNSYYSQLQTPALSEQVKEQVPQIVTKWQSKPEEIQKTAEELQKAVNDIMTFDISSVQNNPLKIKEFIETVDKTYKNVDKVKNDADSILKNFNSDLAEVDALRKSIQNAVTHDMNFANAEINKIKSLNISDGTKLISGMFENVACDVLGKYYPYMMQGIDYITELKSKQASETKEAKKPEEEKSKKTKKKYSVKRAPGRDIFYRQDKTPTVWIKKMAGSGANFFAEATDIASNQDLIDKPAKIHLNMNLYNLDHKAEVVVDFRTDTKEPLVLADYQVGKIPLSIPAAMFGEYPGVPSFDSDCVANAIIKIFDKNGFELTGKALLTKLKITTVPFEPEYASKIYSNVMARVNTVNADVVSGFTLSDGLKMRINSDADVQVMNSLKKEMEAQLAGIKDNLKAELTKKINEASGGALSQFGSLDDIKKNLTDSTALTNTLEKQLNEKKAEAEKQMKAKTDEATKKATDDAKKEIENQFKKLF